MSGKSTGEIYGELKASYYGSKKSAFDAEHFFFRWYRPISFFPSAILIRHGVSANVVTAFGALFLLIAFACLASGQLLLGSLLYLFAYVVDFMDGNVARHAARPTLFGKMIDGLVDSFTFLLFIALGFGNAAAGQSLLSPAAELALGIATGFAFLLRAYFYLRISFILLPQEKSSAQPGSDVAMTVPGRSGMLQAGKRIYFGIISGMLVLLVLAALLGLVSAYLVGYFLLFTLATLFEVTYGLRRVWLEDATPEN